MYNVLLACGRCVKNAVPGHCKDCLRTILLVKPRNKDIGGDSDNSDWIEIHTRPKEYEGGIGAKLCESFLAGEQCMERLKCPFPHSHEEKDLWSK